MADTSIRRVDVRTGFQPFQAIQTVFELFSEPTLPET